MPFRRAGKPTGSEKNGQGARAVAIEITLEAIEADQVAGKQIDAVTHARLAGSLARLLDRLGLTVRPAVSAAPASLRPWTAEDQRKQDFMLAQQRATREGWSDAERDRYAEKLFRQSMAAV
jgi:hypothetical protein